jgi:hypothetical protein
MRRQDLGAARGWLGAVVALLLTATMASAQDGAVASRYGGRIGFSLDPDQFTVGGYVGFPEFARNFTFRPSADLGLGSDLVTVIGNADVQYSITDTSSRFYPFFGAGVGLLWFDQDAGGSDSAVGLNFYAGVEVSMSGYKTGMLEVRLGVDEMPDLKVTYALGFY